MIKCIISFDFLAKEGNRTNIIFVLFGLIAVHTQIAINNKEELNDKFSLNMKLSPKYRTLLSFLIIFQEKTTGLQSSHYQNSYKLSVDGNLV